MYIYLHNYSNEGKPFIYCLVLCIESWLMGLLAVLCHQNWISEDVVALDEWGEDLSFGLYSAERSGSAFARKSGIIRN